MFIFMLNRQTNHPNTCHNHLPEFVFKVSTRNIFYLSLTLVSTPPLSSEERNNSVYLVLITNSYLQSLRDQRDFKHDIIVTARRGTSHSIRPAQSRIAKKIDVQLK